MGSIKAPKMVRMGTLPLIRRNPDRHAKRIGYEKTKNEITTLNGKKSKPKLELVKKSSQETEALKKSSSKIEPVKISPSLKSLPNSGKTHLDAPEAPKMPYVEPWTKYMGMCDCGVKHILHVRNGMIFLPDGSYKAKQVYWRWELIPNMECSEIQVTDKEKHSAALKITSAYFTALEGYMNCYKEYLDDYEAYLTGFENSFQKGSKPPSQIKIENWGPLHDQSYSKADQAKMARKHTWTFGEDSVYGFGPDPVLREYNKDPSDWYTQLEKFQDKFLPKTTLKKFYINLQERYLHLYRKHYQTYSAKLTKTQK